MGLQRTGRRRQGATGKEMRGSRVTVVAARTRRAGGGCVRVRACCSSRATADFLAHQGAAAVSVGAPGGDEEADASLRQGVSRADRQQPKNAVRVCCSLGTVAHNEVPWMSLAENACADAKKHARLAYSGTLSSLLRPPVARPLSDRRPTIVSCRLKKQEEQRDRDRDRPSTLPYFGLDPNDDKAG